MSRIIQYLFIILFIAMPSHTDSIRLCLLQGPKQARQLVESIGISQPTASRALVALGDEILRIGSGRAIQYALRDPGRGPGSVPVYRITADGTIRRLGLLIPVCPSGFVMQQEDGRSLHSESLPWWLADMCPQGFLGRAYAAHHAAALGLPASLAEWTETHMLRALMAHGDNLVGNLLLGDIARERFIDSPPPSPVDESQYPALAAAAERGDVPGSSAGGEQPKFIAFTGQHVLVKFTAVEDNPVTQRWRDLLAAEHLAAGVLRAAGVPAVSSRLFDLAGRRFLEVERFDREGLLGRRALHSLASLEAEFVGDAQSLWPALAAQGIVTAAAADGVALLFAFGTLIGNTDMHNGNLSFIAEDGRPYQLAPAYDMLPMAFAPRSGGGLPVELPPARLHSSIEAATWRQALVLADEFVTRMRQDGNFSSDWVQCADALGRHLEDARLRIARLG
ncbi:type II toxin-antitoxin system HipA family toxin YjjJ [Rhodocyclus tenuis]|uniref:type II toxin-antitoxin system HipA family toxin YjjJ n=1 Tax=Rhodocyclus tenuis TaxID=1066 RepID=UPI001902F924|nr:type II toxin-antitoxin system HipA family toxin YjjJ [Rhodocyclus tenuis]